MLLTPSKNSGKTWLRSSLATLLVLACSSSASDTGEVSLQPQEVQDGEEGALGVTAI